MSRELRYPHLTRASHPKHPQIGVPLPVRPPYLPPEDTSTPGRGQGLNEQRPLPFPSSGGLVTRLGDPAFLDPASAAWPWAGAPTSPSWPAPASKLAPDAVAIETGSPHKNHENKKEAPEMMGPSWGGLPTWAKPSTLSTPGTRTWGRSCLQSPRSTWGGWGRTPRKVAAPPPPCPRKARSLQPAGGRNPTK